MVAAFGAYMLLIPQFGALGAAWGCLIGYGTGAVVAAILASRQGARGAMVDQGLTSAADDDAEILG